VQGGGPRDTRVVGSLPSDQEASGRSLGQAELDGLRDVLASGVLTSTKGSQVGALEAAFADRYGTGDAIACSSGTAAVHTAIAALDLEPGSEIISSPITDMGALTPILYQGCIPVFADVDPVSGNLSAAGVAARITERTGAIVVTHLFGNPAEIEAIVALARDHGVAVVEDCAQAFLAAASGRLLGTFGDIGVFSLQQGKHITTGEGGLVITDDAGLGRRARQFVNKAWGYGDPQPDHTFLALNYRMTELQGAVALAQLGKLDDLVAARVAAAELLTTLIEDVPGIAAPAVTPGGRHTYWRYTIRVDGDLVDGGPDALAGKLAGYDIGAAPRYIKKPAFQCAVFQDQRTFGASRWPFTLATADAVDYDPARYPGTFAALDSMLVLPFNERYIRDHVMFIGASLCEAAASVGAGS